MFEIRVCLRGAGWPGRQDWKVRGRPGAGHVGDSSSERGSGPTVPAALMPGGDQEGPAPSPVPTHLCERAHKPSSPRAAPGAGLSPSHELQPPLAGRAGHALLPWGRGHPPWTLEASGRPSVSSAWPSLQRHTCMASASGAPCAVSPARSWEQRPQGPAPPSRATSPRCAPSLPTGHPGASLITLMPATSVSRNTSLPTADEGLSAREPSGLSRVDGPAPRVDGPSGVCPGRMGRQVCVQGGRASTQGGEGQEPLPPSHSHPSRGPIPAPHPRGVSSTAVTTAVSRVYRAHSSAPEGLERRACVLGLPECRRGRLGVTCQAGSLLCVKA